MGHWPWSEVSGKPSGIPPLPSTARKPGLHGVGERVLQGPTTEPENRWLERRGDRGGGQVACAPIIQASQKHTGGPSPHLRKLRGPSSSRSYTCHWGHTYTETLV